MVLDFLMTSPRREWQTAQAYPGPSCQCFALFICLKRKKEAHRFALSTLAVSPLSIISNMRTLCVTFFVVILSLGKVALSSMLTFLHSYPFSSLDSIIVEHPGSVWSQHAPCLGIYSYSLWFKLSLMAFVPPDSTYSKPAGMFLHSCLFSSHDSTIIEQHPGSVWSQHAPCGRCKLGICSYSLYLVIVAHGFCTSRLHVFETCQYVLIFVSLFLTW